MKNIILTAAVLSLTIGQIIADNGKNAKILLNADQQIYMDAHEVTVGDYMVYVNIMKNSSNKEYYYFTLPDEKICKDVYGEKDIFANNNFADMPMVGLTLKQIQAYCAWRTDFNNTKKSANKQRFIYQLPTLEQMQMAYDKQKDKTKNLSICAVNTKSHSFTGIADNAQEITADNKLIIGERYNKLRSIAYNGDEPSNVGFRCVIISLE